MTKEIDLAFGLASAGLPLVTVPDSTAKSSPPAVSELSFALLESDNPLFVMCIVPLLLFNPVAAGSAPEGDRRLPDARRRVFEHLYTMAAALRARWKTRLTMDGVTHDLPDLYSTALGLSGAYEGYGDICLAMMADRFEAGDAGVVLRGAVGMAERLVDQSFKLYERKVAGAPTG
jgi:hypothetical protein